MDVTISGGLAFHTSIRNGQILRRAENRARKEGLGGAGGKWVGFTRFGLHFSCRAFWQKERVRQSANWQVRTTAPPGQTTPAGAISGQLRGKDALGPKRPIKRAKTTGAISPDRSLGLASSSRALKRMPCVRGKFLANKMIRPQCCVGISGKPACSNSATKCSRIGAFETMR